MAELAINQFGQTFTPPAEVAHWLVRRMSDNKHGGPVATVGTNGSPITLPVAASMAEFRAALTAHGCAPGRYRLDPLDAQGRPIKGPVAYLTFPPDRVATIDAAELPRNSNGAGAASTPPQLISTGAFPLPVPMHFSGLEYLLGEAMRTQQAMLTQMALHTGTLITAAAELVRAADGAKLPSRKPATEAPAPAPQVIVQQVPVMYEEPPIVDEPDEAPPAAPAPTAPPVWQQMIGDALTQLMPLVPMFLGDKLAGAMPPAPVAPVSAPPPPAPVEVPRNAAPPIVEDEPIDEPAVEPINIEPAAWSHLSAVVRGLGLAWKARIDAQLARMAPDVRRSFVVSLASLSVAAATDAVIAMVAVAEQHQARAQDPAPTPTAPVAPTHDASDPGAPTEADLPTPTPTSGTHARHATRVMIADEAPPTAAPADAFNGPMDEATAAALMHAGPSPLGELYTQLAEENSPVGAVLRKIPGGAAMVEAAATTLLGAEGVAQINAAIADAPVPPILQALIQKQAAPAVSLSSPAAMARMVEILPHLTAGEQATARVLAMRLPAPERSALLARLVAVDVPTAVAIVRDAVATYEVHGRPFG